MVKYGPKGVREKVERAEQASCEDGGKTGVRRSVSLFEFLRDKPVLQSIMADYKAKKAKQAGLSVA